MTRRPLPTRHSTISHPAQSRARFLPLAFCLAAALLLQSPTATSGFGQTNSPSAATPDSPKKAAADDKQDSIDQDYAGELPRIAPKSTQEALAAFHVAPGFQVQLVAAEPDIVDPVAMAFDENSRLYVVEMRDYSEDDKANLGRVRLLEDRDGDGRVDKSTIFAEGISWPTAIICYDGGVFVAAPPEVYFLRDNDGDGRADEKKHLFTGFARSNVQGLINSFQWGYDNRIYAATSSSGASVVPGPDHPAMKSGQMEDMAAIALRGRDFSFDPRTLKIEPASGGAQHGMSFDDWGVRFDCSNSDHLQQILFEDRYVARNPYLAAPSARLSIAADGPQADVYRTSPVEPWRIVRTRLRMKGVVPGPVEGGGRAAGYFTSATGITIYRGNAWPQEFQGLAIVGDVGGNLIHRKRLESNGIPYVGRRMDEKTEFVTSDDIWFRPVQFANAPDGSLYVADMYREVIEHPASLHPVIKKHLDLTSGRDRGRIYRIVPTGFQYPALPKLGQATTAELVATLAHPNGWHRDTAARLLFQRQDKSAVGPLAKLAVDCKLPQGRIAALWALDGLKALAPELALTALQDADGHAREHALRLAESLLADSAPIREKLFAMVADENLRVRYQLAFTLGQTTDPRRTTALAALARRDAADSWIRLAVRSSLGTDCGAVLADLAADEKFRVTGPGREWLRQLAEQIGKQQRADDVADLLGALRTIPATESATLQTLLQGVAAKPGTPLAEQIAAATGGRADQLYQELVAAAERRAVDNEAKLADRVAAAQQLKLGSFAKLAPTFAKLLEISQPAELQNAALAVLASFREPEVARLIVDRWSTFSPRLRSQAADVLFSRPTWIVTLVEAVQQDKVATGDVDPARWRLLAAHPDEKVRSQAAKILARLQVSRRGEVVDAYRDTLTAPGDAARGKEMFKKVCAACHQLQGVGFATGPNLAAMKARGPEAILVNVLDPNREVNPQYLNYTLVTSDGRTLSGIISAETATSVTLTRADNARDIVLRIDIDELRSTGMSLMPEGLEKQVDKQAMADLLEYLKSVD